MRDDSLVMDDEVNDLSVSQLIRAVDFERWCGSEPMNKWPRAQRARDVLCEARSQIDVGDAEWISADATDGVIVGNDGRVLQYGDDGWTQVFPRPTAYGKLLPSSPYDHKRLETNRDGDSAEPVRPASWSWLPGLWASDDGTAYVAFGTAVLKRTGPGKWESIYEDNSEVAIPGNTARSLYVAVLTSIWGSSNDELYVGSSAGFVSRYDGKNWTREFADAQASITAIWGSGNDVWASGADLSSTMTFRAAACRQDAPCLSFDREGEMFSAHRALLLRRVDGAWRRVDLPDSLPTLSSVWASGPSDVYVGTLGAGLWHFDGGRWSRRILQRSASDKKDLSPAGLSGSDHRYRSPDFVHAIRGVPNGQLFVQASPHGYTSHVGRMLFVLKDGGSESIRTDCLVEPGGIEAQEDRVLVPMGHCGMVELQGEVRTRYRALGDVQRVWAGEQYDYALSDEGHFWFRKHPSGH
jgi:hypothetical protein